ncbi:MAG TPA: DinB family protein [Pyrinomonadaceae bacterium]|nr:DinB family protein [Pyrinomonadaceae bacterium]
MGLNETLIKIYDRDILKLREEVEKYGDEADLWKKHGDLPNSGGTLALHLCGNLRHFIGAILGKSGYVRDRDAEFAMQNVPRDAILSAIDETREVVTATLAKLAIDDLAKTYPIEALGYPMTTEYFLVHLASHLSYHLGQINYHRRSLGS